jgi:hypothetical protein
MAKTTTKKADEDYVRPIPPHKRKRTTRLVFTESESDFPALNLSRPPKKNSWTERSILSTKNKRKIEEAEVTAAGSQDKVMTEGSTPLFSDKIATLRTDMKRIEAMQTEMTTFLRVNTEQMSKLTKMQETQTQAATQMQATVNNLLTCAIR